MAHFVKIALVIIAVVGGLKLFGIGPFSDPDAGRSLGSLLSRASAESKDKVVVLLTGTDWCPYCMELERDVLNSPEWQEFARNEIVFESYEYPAMNRPKSGVRGEMLAKFNIEGFPTMVVLDKWGKVLGQQAGYGGMSTGQMKSWISEL